MHLCVVSSTKFFTTFIKTPKEEISSGREESRLENLWWRSLKPLLVLQLVQHAQIKHFNRQIFFFIFTLIVVWIYLIRSESTVTTFKLLLNSWLNSITLAEACSSLQICCFCTVSAKTNKENYWQPCFTKDTGCLCKQLHTNQVSVIVRRLLVVVVIMTVMTMIGLDWWVYKTQDLVVLMLCLTLINIVSCNHDLFNNMCLLL